MYTKMYTFIKGSYKINLHMLPIKKHSAIVKIE